MKNQFLIFGISAPAKGSADHCAPPWLGPPSGQKDGKGGLALGQE